MAVWKPQQHVVFYTILLGAITLVADYVTGPYIRFPVLFILPVLLASWYRGWPLGIGVAILLPTLRLGLAWHWDATTPWTMTEPIVNALVHIMVLVPIAYLAAMLSQERKALQEEVAPSAVCCRFAWSVKRFGTIREIGRFWKPISCATPRPTSRMASVQPACKNITGTISPLEVIVKTPVPRQRCWP
jgi:hypothetical protein